MWWNCDCFQNVKLSKIYGVQPQIFCNFFYWFYKNFQTILSKDHMNPRCLCWNKRGSKMKKTDLCGTCLLLTDDWLIFTLTSSWTGVPENDCFSPFQQFFKVSNKVVSCCVWTPFTPGPHFCTDLSKVCTILIKAREKKCLKKFGPFFFFHRWVGVKKNTLTLRRTALRDVPQRLGKTVNILALLSW